jgi:hypothetical protein
LAVTGGVVVPVTAACNNLMTADGHDPYLLTRLEMVARF